MSVNTRASLVLVFTCACWAFSFPIMKSIEQVGRVALPHASSLFFASLCIAIRFTLAGIVLALVCARSLNRLTRLEIWQGGGLGLFGGIGLVLQMDGMVYTLASTSAFLTQAYCILIPLWLSIRYLRWPAPQVMGACLLALFGAALLARLGTDDFHFGRGEWETLAGSVLFTGQILWLERPLFRGNNSIRATTVMFVVMALTTWPMALATAPNPGAILQAYNSPAAIILLALLTGLCTLITFPLANHWQPRITATQAGLLYCTEPVFTSFVALFFPAWISLAAHIDYPNETLNLHLVAGGLLILVANAWLLFRPPPLHTVAHPIPHTAP